MFNIKKIKRDYLKNQRAKRMWYYFSNLKLDDKGVSLTNLEELSYVPGIGTEFRFTFTTKKSNFFRYGYWTSNTFYLVYSYTGLGLTGIYSYNVLNNFKTIKQNHGFRISSLGSLANRLLLHTFKRNLFCFFGCKFSLHGVQINLTEFLGLGKLIDVNYDTENSLSSFNFVYELVTTTGSYPLIGSDLYGSRGNTKRDLELVLHSNSNSHGVELHRESIFFQINSSFTEILMSKLRYYDKDTLTLEKKTDEQCNFVIHYSFSSKNVLGPLKVSDSSKIDKIDKILHLKSPLNFKNFDILLKEQLKIGNHL